MAQNEPTIVRAGERESGARCTHCALDLLPGAEVASCPACGAVQHYSCWHAAGGCGSYECLAGRRLSRPASIGTLTVTRDELDVAQPLPARVTSYEPPPEPPLRWNRAAVGAFVVSVLGIPLFGLVTGIVAIIVACVALVGGASNRKGTSLAVLAMVLGLGDVVGWAIGLWAYLRTPTGMVTLDDLAIDSESLDELPDRIARAMRANVLIQSEFALGRRGVGSGVILKIRDGSAYIVTNRHVIDPDFAESDGAPAKADLAKMATILVTTVSQTTAPGVVEWVAPHGVDLAIVSLPLVGGAAEVREALWDAAATPHIGDPVFAVGNPHGLGWTHSAGGISQIRRRTVNDYEIRILQSTAAINPGNSGGGLYDADGRLIGINTITADKRLAEGLGFSIALPILLDLADKSLQLPQANSAGEPPVDATVQAPPGAADANAHAASDLEEAKHP